MTEDWEQSKAEIWNNALRHQEVLRVEPISWPCVCQECHGNDSENCWKCSGTGEEASEPAVLIVFANGAKLIVRSEYAAALFVRTA